MTADQNWTPPADPAPADPAPAAAAPVEAPPAPTTDVTTGPVADAPADPSVPAADPTPVADPAPAQAPPAPAVTASNASPSTMAVGTHSAAIRAHALFARMIKLAEAGQAEIERYVPADLLTAAEGELLSFVREVI